VIQYERKNIQMYSALATHPMYDSDRPVIDMIVSKPLRELSKQDIVDLARLANRYVHDVGGHDLREMIIQYLDTHGKSLNDLQIKSREIWQSGWRPNQLGHEEVGSGADVEAGSV